jgi:carboxymethylenebutenolidase
MGGQLALFAATLNPSIGATVNFYGIHPEREAGLFEALRARCSVLFAEKDGS